MICNLREYSMKMFMWIHGTGCTKGGLSFPVLSRSYPMDKSPIQWILYIRRIEMRCMKPIGKHMIIE